MSRRVPPYDPDFPVIGTCKFSGEERVPLQYYRGRAGTKWAIEHVRDRDRFPAREMRKPIDEIRRLVARTK